MIVKIEDEKQSFILKYVYHDSIVCFFICLLNMNMHGRMYKQCEKEDEDQKYLA